MQSISISTLLHGVASILSDVYLTQNATIKNI